MFFFYSSNVGFLITLNFPNLKFPGTLICLDTPGFFIEEHLRISTGRFKRVEAVHYSRVGKFLKNLKLLCRPTNLPSMRAFNFCIQIISFTNIHEYITQFKACNHFIHNSSQRPLSERLRNMFNSLKGLFRLKNVSRSESWNWKWCTYTINMLSCINH